MSLQLNMLIKWGMPLKMPISIRSPILRRDFLDNVEIINLVEKLKEELHSTKRGRQDNELVKNYNRKLRAYIRLSREKLKMLTGFLLVHCRFKEHPKNIRIENHRTCGFCHEGEKTT